MKKVIPLVAAALVCGAATSLPAQSGFALKGHYVFNESNAKNDQGTGFEEVPSPDGFSLGAELVLPMGIGVGVTGYAEGSATEFDTETSSFGVIAEANYFIRVPVLPLRPYVGVHAGLGRYPIDSLDDTTPKIEDSRTQLGWQAGVRLQLSSTFALDGQFRHMSDSASDDQSPDLERNQVLIGIALF